MKRTFLHIISFVFIVLFSLTLTNTFAQKSQKYYEPVDQYRKALDLLSRKKYASAQRFFDEVQRAETTTNSEIKANASYYKAYCGLKLFNQNAENLLIEFITQYPESPKVNRARFDLGLYQYRKRKYSKAIEWFNQVDVYNLDSEELAEYYFKLGYSYFKEDNNKEATRALFEIKDADTRYSVVAKYYYAHLSYEAENYEIALKYFREIENENGFSTVIPYYITQILFHEKQYEEVIAYAEILIDSGRAQRKFEIAKLVGESYFAKDEFEKALPYLTMYSNNTGEAEVDDWFQIALAYAALEDHLNAVQYFQQAISENDTTNQIVQYNMAKSYLALEKKRLARNAMRTASIIEIDPEITENALYSYAKLSYELSQYPFNDAVRAFEQYLSRYPNSDKTEEANEYLIDVYFTTRNYQDARESLDRIPNRSLQLNMAYQKILYYLGVEEMNKGQYEKSIAYYDLAIAMEYDRTVKVNSIYWKAEALFRLLKYDASAEQFTSFLNQPGAISSEFFHTAQYNLGYAYYRKRDYDKAIFRFRQFADNAKDESPKMVNDALLRTADAYFITKDYRSATEYYDKATEMAVFETDYAIFQSALAHGVMSQYDQKMAKLDQLLNSYPKSLYADDALYELGDIKFIQGDNEGAQQHFEKLIAEKKDSPYFGKAMLKSGLIYFNTNLDTLALDRFKVVVQDFGNTSESKQALEKIKQIYIDRGDLQGFETYIAGLGIDDIPANRLDSASYEIAENAYLKNNCEEAVKNFSLYLKKYDQGLFATNARYYRGSCELRAGHKEEALLDFEKVIAEPKNLFTEKSLYNAAVISREMGENEKAMNYYSMLELKADQQVNIDQAQYWLMRLNFEKGNDKEAMKYADIILQKENLSEDIERIIWVFQGRSYLKSDKYNKSFDTYSNLIDYSDEYAAEAKYNLAYIEFMRGNIDSSEKYIDILLNQVPAYDYWIAKAFILWSDIYTQRSDNYQAKVSLQTVIENYEGEDLVNQAKSKLEAIEKLEEIEKESKESEKEEFEIKFEGEEDYDYLFDEEVFENEEVEST